MNHTESDIDAVFNSGYKGTFWFMQQCFPIMKEKGYGKIINLSSKQGIIGEANYLAYASVKEAIRALSRVAAKEWGQYGIRVNTIAPVVMTVLNKNCPGGDEGNQSCKTLSFFPIPH